MNKYLSDKLKITSLTGMIIVVYVHSYNLTVNFNSGSISFYNQYNHLLQNFFIDYIGVIALALFFSISGYLFFLNFKVDFDNIFTKYQRKVKSLLLPYLLWSLWGIFIYFILQSIPQSKEFFTRDFVSSYHHDKILETLFINPIPYQLWFLRDLIMMVICSPLIYLALKYAKIIPVFILFLNWLGFLDISFVIFADNSIFFFSAGAYLSINNQELIAKRSSRSTGLSLALIWILLVVFDTILMEGQTGHPLIPSLIKKSTTVTGLLALWSAYDLVISKKQTLSRKLLSFSSYSFFIYLSHEPLLTMIKKGLFYITGYSELISMANFLIAPILTILICVNSAKLIHSLHPKFYHMINGGR